MIVLELAPINVVVDANCTEIQTQQLIFLILQKIGEGIPELTLQELKSLLYLVSQRGLGGFPHE
ncbi:hypothetical protein OA07_13325 [Aphanizomenon flos-aquae 2012/KM1/D3]|nr:hypothetical protein OA07_13325 [Aphanizomenon flos-aquae 2012/KM1/D3]